MGSGWGMADVAVAERQIRPASPVHEGFWRADQAGVTGARDRVSRAFRIRGELDPAALGDAVRLAANSYASLRTRFHYWERTRSCGNSGILQELDPDCG